MLNSKDQIGTQIKTEESNKTYQKQLEDRVEKQQETIKLLLEVIDLIHFVGNDMFHCTTSHMVNKNLGYDPKLDDKKLTKDIVKLKKKLKFDLSDVLPYRYETMKTTYFSNGPRNVGVSCIINIVNDVDAQNKLFELNKDIFRAAYDGSLTPELVKSFYEKWRSINGGKEPAE